MVGQEIKKKIIIKRLLSKNENQKDKDWARGWDKEKINRCFLFDKHIRDV